MSETTEALIGRVLGAHEWEYPDSFCKCGAWMSLGTPWRAHVAAAIAEALAGVDVHLCSCEAGDHTPHYLNPDVCDHEETR